MSEKTLISAREIERVELLLSPNNNYKEVYRYHQHGCQIFPTALRERPISCFSSSPDNAIVRVWLKGFNSSINAGMAVLFDKDSTSVELGSLFVSPLFRGFGFGQLLVDALVTKFYYENHLGNYSKVNIIARVRYGNYAPIPILNRCGFKVSAIKEKKSHWSYQSRLSQKTAARLYDSIVKIGAIIEDDLFNSLISVHARVRTR